MEPDLQFDDESGHRVVQTHRAQGLDPLQPVAQCIAVDTQPLGCHREITAGVEVGQQGGQVLGESWLRSTSSEPLASVGYSLASSASSAMIVCGRSSATVQRPGVQGVRLRLGGGPERPAVRAFYQSRRQTSSGQSFLQFPGELARPRVT